MVRWRDPTIQGRLISTRLAYAPFSGSMYRLERLSKEHSPRLASRLIQLTFAQIKATLFSSPSCRPPFVLLHRWCEEAILSPRRLRLHQDESKQDIRKEDVIGKMHTGTMVFAVRHILLFMMNRNRQP
ncbi:hypothetical protein ARMGADRAFT_287707 [Armillaria gallica]|uniref:Uncharacterized protein n=1 Tax=Armillaria gallica TaxID=47427 RepID=A0A2H3DI25_ARMGA|nr:hypothetical protein ARMGADRAFT_287707 [Armillaria gallica]